MPADAGVAIAEVVAGGLRLRDQGAAEAIKVGVNLVTLSKIMGHTSVVTIRKYCHSIGDGVELILSELAKIPQKPKR
jgi:hypothetical protein